MNTKNVSVTRLAAAILCVSALRGAEPGERIGGYAAARTRSSAVLERLRADGDVERAKSELLRVLVDEPNAQGSLFDLGAIYERERDWNAAIDFYGRAERAAPSSQVGKAASERLAAVRRIATLGATADGREQLRYEIGLARASEAQRNNRIPEAMEVLESIHRTSPERWEAPAMIASMLVEERKDREAAAYLRAARRNAPPSERDRFDRAIETLLSPSWHLFDKSLAQGPRKAADVERVSREMLAPRGGEYVKEAAAHLVSRDIESAVRVLRTAVSERANDAALAWRMLREVASVSAEAKEFLVTAPQPSEDTVQRGRTLARLLADPVTEEMRRSAADPPKLIEDRAATTAEATLPLAEEPKAQASQACTCQAPVAPASTLAAPAKSLVVQVAAYRDAGRAAEHARRLAAMGFDARASEEGSVHRVIVGPFVSEQGASEARERLAKEGYGAGVLRARSGG